MTFGLQNTQAIIRAAYATHNNLLKEGIIKR